MLLIVGWIGIVMLLMAAKILDLAWPRTTR